MNIVQIMIILTSFYCFAVGYLTGKAHSRDQHFTILAATTDNEIESIEGLILDLEFNGIDLKEYAEFVKWKKERKVIEDGI